MQTFLSVYELRSLAEKELDELKAGISLENLERKYDNLTEAGLPWLYAVQEVNTHASINKLIIEKLEKFKKFLQVYMGESGLMDRGKLPLTDEIRPFLILLGMWVPAKKEEA